MADPLQKHSLRDSNIIGVLDDDEEIQPLQGINGIIKVLLTDGVSVSGSLGCILTQDIVLIHTSDITGTVNDYPYATTGAAGLPLTIKTYDTGAESGDYAILTTYRYQDATYPTVATKKIDSISTV